MREIKLVWDRNAGGLVPPVRLTAREPFVRGPIPTKWLQTAARLPGKALHVGLVAWYVSGLSGRRDNLPLSTERLRQFGVTRQSKLRALRALEQAGLLSVTYRANRAPLVTLDVRANGRTGPDGAPLPK